jgi:hypothetical protein
VRSRLPLLAALGFLGCRHAPAAPQAAVATAPPAPPRAQVVDARSGARLKAVWASPPGDSGVFWTWHDTKLGVDCRFAVAADGQMRCLPVDAIWAGSAYADSACTATPLAFNFDERMPTTSAGPRWLAPPGSSSDGSAPRFLVSRFLCAP